MLRSIVVLALVGACGRVRFDERIDGDAIIDSALATHDEDGDGFVDASDVCPHIPGPQVDTDGDGVGDLCDPDSAGAKETLAFFDPMLTSAGFTLVTGDWIALGDALHCDGTLIFCEVTRIMSFRNGYIEIGMTITAQPMAMQHQVSISPFVDTLMSTYYYAEVFAFDTTPGYAAVAKHEGTMFTPISQTPMANGVHTGAFTLRFSTTVAGLRMEATWLPSEGYTRETGAADYVGGNMINIGFQGVVAEVNYMIVVATM